MGYWYHLAPTSAKFVREVEDLIPEVLDAYILEKYPDTEPNHPFLLRLLRTPRIYLGGAAPMEAFRYGKPLFNRPETQDAFTHFSPYVVNRRSVGVLIDWWYTYMKEEENDRKTRNKRGNSAKWVRERLRLLRIVERRCPLFILYVT